MGMYIYLYVYMDVCVCIHTKNIYTRVICFRVYDQGDFLSNGDNPCHSMGTFRGYESTYYVILTLQASARRSGHGIMITGSHSPSSS